MRQLNLINRYYVLIFKNNLFLKFYDSVGVDKVFFHHSTNTTIIIANKKIDIILQKFGVEDIYLFGFKLIELEELSKQESKYKELFPIIKEKLNWYNYDLNLSIALHQMDNEPDPINKFLIKVKDIDDSLNYLSYYCESVEVKEFLPEYHGLIEIETQLSMEEIKEVLRGALLAHIDEFGYICEINNIK